MDQLTTVARIPSGSGCAASLPAEVAKQPDKDVFRKLLDLGYVVDKNGFIVHVGPS